MAIRIAAISPRCITGDIRHNTEIILTAANEAARVCASVLILPKDAVTGADCGFLTINRDFIRNRKNAEDAIAERLKELNISVRYSTSELSYAGKFMTLRRRLLNESEQNESAFIYVNAAPTNTVSRGVYGGEVFACQGGKILAECGMLSWDNNVAIFDIEGDLYEVVNTSGGFDIEPALRRNPYFPKDKKDYPAFCDEVTKLQYNALASRLGFVKAHTAVINVSGGLDSAHALLITCLAADSIGMKRSEISALILPGFGTSARTLNNARRLCKILGVAVDEIDIRDGCTTVFNNIKHDKTVDDLTFENTQARYRTMLALNIANKRGGFMVGTGNMSEAALGFTTFGGDALSMYNPNCGLTKTAMREIVQYLIKSETVGNGVSVILEDILNTPISPELRFPRLDCGDISQVTEDIVGPYELNDFFLYHHLLGYGMDEIEIFAKTVFVADYLEEVIQHWLASFTRRFYAASFKRIMMPEGPAVLYPPLTDKFIPGDIKL
ncbi:MAG: NAD(+) synthase [Defluviitaleaceae bacterium]|nr:NAD(+) synthase [Defluviitaleaceae bacterium]